MGSTFLAVLVEKNSCEPDGCANRHGSLLYPSNSVKRERAEALLLSLDTGQFMILGVYLDAASLLLLVLKNFIFI